MSSRFAADLAARSDETSTRSVSGQFVVRGLPRMTSFNLNSPTSEVRYVRLDPVTLAVSCERTKSAVLDELGMPDQWRGGVGITLRPVRQFDEPIDIVSVRYADGWRYRMAIPDQVDRSRLIEALVQVVLLEIANRTGPAALAELPPWLAPGLAAEVESKALDSLALDAAVSLDNANNSWLVRRQRRTNPLQPARQWLTEHAPLSMDQLNWPPDSQNGASAQTYRACAQIFLHELLRLRDGKACLGQMLTRLPAFLNWQTAFLQAFQQHFVRMLDVAKWWSLNVEHSTGRDLVATLSARDTLDQLDQALAGAATVQGRPQESPKQVPVSLQKIITDWPSGRQIAAIQQRLGLLQELRSRASEDLVSLVDDYRTALRNYVQAKTTVRPEDTRTGPKPTPTVQVPQLLERLNMLDAQRAMLRQALQLEPVSTQPLARTTPEGQLLSPLLPPSSANGRPSP